VRFADRVVGLLEWPDGTRRLGVLGCVAVLVVGIAYHYPGALRDAGREADHYASLSYSDREFAGGNSVVADQGGLYEARGRIPADGSYEVSVGPRVEGWTDLTAPFVPWFARYFLLPRRQLDDAPWVLCYACDLGDYPGYETVYTGSDGISLLRRPA
jgi:hypothetical protein